MMDNTEQRIKQVMADVFDMPAETILDFSRFDLTD